MQLISQLKRAIRGKPAIFRRSFIARETTGHQFALACPFIRDRVDRRRGLVSLKFHVPLSCIFMSTCFVVDFLTSNQRRTDWPRGLMSSTRYVNHVIQDISLLRLCQRDCTDEYSIAIVDKLSFRSTRSRWIESFVFQRSLDDRSATTDPSFFFGKKDWRSRKVAHGREPNGANQSERALRWIWWPLDAVDLRELTGIRLEEIRPAGRHGCRSVDEDPGVAWIKGRVRGRASWLSVRDVSFEDKAIRPRRTGDWRIPSPYQASTRMFQHVRSSTRVGCVRVCVCVCVCVCVAGTTFEPGSLAVASTLRGHATSLEKKENLPCRARMLHGSSISSFTVYAIRQPAQRPTISAFSTIGLTP